MVIVWGEERLIEEGHSQYSWSCCISLLSLLSFFPSPPPSPQHLSLPPFLILAYFETAIVFLSIYEK